MELIVGALVVLGFLAILTRFGTRDPSGSGEFRLPRIVDDSIGMWALRRITRRRLLERPWDDATPSASPIDRADSDATRATLGATAAAQASDLTNSTLSTTPTRYVVSQRRSQAHPDPASPASAVSQNAARRTRSRRAGLAGLRPRLAGMATTMAVVVVAVVALGFALTPPGDGGVLQATGRPGGTPDAVESQVALLPDSSPSVTPTEPTEPTEPPEPASVEPTGTPLGTPGATPTVTAAPTPRPTQRPTARPTARPTPPATPAPTPTPTPQPTPKPTPKPTPAPTPTLPPLPVASITCDIVLLRVSCDGSDSARAVSYRFTFGDGFVVSGTDPTVSRTYLDFSKLGNPVSLVVRDARNRASQAETWNPS